MANKRDIAKKKRPLPQKKMGCLPKLIILLLFVAGGFGAYVYFTNKDEIKNVDDFIAKSKSTGEDLKRRGVKFSKSAFAKELLAGIENLTKAAQEQLKAIASESEEDVRKDVDKYEKAQSKERKAEVEKEMKEIQKISKKTVSEPKSKKVRTIEDALTLKLSMAKNEEMIDAVEMLRTDVDAREILYKKNKKKNKDQIDIAITHARLAKQMLYKINDKKPDQPWTLETMRKVSTKIRTLVRLKNES